MFLPLSAEQLRRGLCSRPMSTTHVHGRAGVNDNEEDRACLIAGFIYCFDMIGCLSSYAGAVLLACGGVAGLGLSLAGIQLITQMMWFAAKAVQSTGKLTVQQGRLMSLKSAHRPMEKADALAFVAVDGHEFSRVQGNAQLHTGFARARLAQS